jgi:ribonuclease HI
MKIDMYTDGGCLNNGRPNARAAYGYYVPEHTISFACRVPDDRPQTNNVGELMGILEGLRKLQAMFPAAETDVHVYTDSEYAKNCLTAWMPAWIARGWKTATGTPVSNRDLLEGISSELLQFASYTITHVRAHTGKQDEHSRNNHIVDRLVADVLSPSPKGVPTTNVVAGPLQPMGPPVSEDVLAMWCTNNLHELDQGAVRSALLTAYCKTMRQNGYDILKTKHHRSTDYRLTTGVRLVDK